MFQRGGWLLFWPLIFLAPLYIVWAPYPSYLDSVDPLCSLAVQHRCFCCRCLVAKKRHVAYRTLTTNVTANRTSMHYHRRSARRVLVPA